MNAPFARGIAWFLVGTFFILTGIGLFFQILTQTTPADLKLPLLLFVITFAVVGLWPVIAALIITHHPHHVVGWLLLVSIAVVALDVFTLGYISYANIGAPGVLPIPGVLLVWLNWSGLPFVAVTFSLMNLLFPSGRLPSPRWRLLVWTCVAGLLFYLSLQTIEPGQLSLYTALDNPYAVAEPVWTRLAPFYFATIAILSLCNLLSALDLARRLRRTQGDERQQIKWLVVPAVLFAIATPFVFLTDYDPNGLMSMISVGVHVVTVPAIVIAVAFSIFKYRLYDIDIIINRTIVYGGLSAAIAVLYVLTVGVTGALLHQNSHLPALVLTVGIVATAYRPLHAIVQKRVDRWLGPAPASSTALATPVGEESVTTATADRPQQPVVLASAHWMAVARGGWLLLAIVALVVLLFAIPGLWLRHPMGNLGTHLDYQPTTLMLVVHHLNLALAMLVVLLSYGLAAILFLKRRTEPMALFTAYYLLVHGLLFGGAVELLEPFWPSAAAVNSFILLPALNVPLSMTLFAIFPDGRFVPSWTRRLVAMTLLLGGLTAFFLYKQNQNRDDNWISAPVIVISAIWFVIYLALVWAQVYRYRYISNLLQRQQTKWVLYGFLVMMGLSGIASGPWHFLLSLPSGTAMPWWVPFMETTWITAIAILPVALTISVLRYRLYAVDVLFNRTLVYGALSMSVVALYVLVVGGLGVLLQAEGALLISLVATGVVAVLFQPMRERLQQGVNRFFYGQRDDPLGALAQLGRQLETAVTPDVILPTLVETIAQTLKLPYVAISLRSRIASVSPPGDGPTVGQAGSHPIIPTGAHEDYRIVAQTGTAGADLLSLPLIYQGETVGQLVAGARGADDPFSQTDRQLLENIAHQAGLTAYAVQLTQDLRLSRVRLVTAREEERRRLRRDLHDGLGPVLASQGLKMAAASHLLAENPVQVQQLLEELMAQNAVTISEIRRLVYDLRPAALDDLGLVGAVRDYASGLKGGVADSPRLQIEVQSPAVGLPSLPAAIEVAAYRIATEALTNVARHARARRVTVAFALPPANGTHNLHIEIADDGIGMPQPRRAGIGLISMRERAEEVGGAFLIKSTRGRGTCISADLPLPALVSRAV